MRIDVFPPNFGGLLQGLSEEEVARVAQLALERAYKKGTTIFSVGDPSHELFIVRKGYVKLVSISRKAETIIRVFKPSEIFGELFLVADRRAFNAVAMDNAVLAVIPKQAFLQLVATVPRLALNFIHFVLKRLREAEEELSDLTHAWAKEKLARLLLRLCEEHGRETAEGTEILLPLTRQTLADMIGVSRVTVTMQLLELAREGIGEFRGRRLVVYRDRLAAYLRLSEGWHGEC